MMLSTHSLLVFLISNSRSINIKNKTKLWAFGKWDFFSFSFSEKPKCQNEILIFFVFDFEVAGEIYWQL